MSYTGNLARDMTGDVQGDKVVGRLDVKVTGSNPLTANQLPPLGSCLMAAASFLRSDAYCYFINTEQYDLQERD